MMSDDRVEPPPEHCGHRWHWLVGPDGDMVVARWQSGSGGAWAIVSTWRQARLMARDGYRYLAPCIPPEVPDVE